MRSSLRTLLLTGIFLGFPLLDNSKAFKESAAKIAFQLSDTTLRESKLSDFSYSYKHAWNNWDNFDRQFYLVRHLIFSDSAIIRIPNSDKTKVRSAAVNSPDTLISILIDPVSLVHELAHIWYFNLVNQRNFNERWKEISGEFTYKEKLFLEDLFKGGSISYHSLTNIREDVAETVGLVYMLNDPRFVVMGFPNKHSEFRIKTDTTPTYYQPDAYNMLLDTEKSKIIAKKLRQKVLLLQNYGFFSDREAEHAIREFDYFLNK